MALKDITLGQYFPGNSLLHRLDPRTKILAVVLYIVALFLAKHFFTYAIMFCVLALSISLSHVPLKSLFRGMKPVVFIVVLVSAANAGTTMPHSRAAERPAAMVRFILFSPFCYAAAVVISTPSLAHSYWLYAVYSDRYALSTFSFAVVTASCAC